jgi:hypothetical protein
VLLDLAGVPRYVGMTTNLDHRIAQHRQTGGRFKRSRQYHQDLVAFCKNGFRIGVFARGLTEAEASNYEEMLIDLFGRTWDETGSLYNRVKGGRYAGGAYAPLCPPRVIDDWLAAPGNAAWELERKKYLHQAGKETD